MKQILLLITSLLFSTITICQNKEALLQDALLNDEFMAEDLRQLCDLIGGRVTGSTANEAAVSWAIKRFETANVSVRKEAFEMPVLWLPKSTQIKIKELPLANLQVVSKYQSPPGTYAGQLVDGMDGDSAYLASIQNLIKGNVILFESDLCLDIAGLFNEYATAAKAEGFARQYGAKAVVFMSSRPKKLLYRFITSEVAENSLPQLVMAREDAKRCLRTLRSGQALNIDLAIEAETGQAFTAHNVIGEIRGGKYPDEVVVVGAHIDSWALGTGANDNGCNVSMLINIARQMKKLNIQPDRTIRFALWNGEEQGYFGSWAYIKNHASELDNHKMAMSIDIGSGAINGFFTNGREDLQELMNSMKLDTSIFGEIANVNVPIVGTDNFDFMLEGVPNLVGNHLSANYGTNYHASSDTYDKVDFESLKKNSALVAQVLLHFANEPSSIISLPRHNRVEIQAMFDANKLEYTMRMFNVWEPWVRGERGRK